MCHPKNGTRTTPMKPRGSARIKTNHIRARPRWNPRHPRSIASRKHLELAGGLEGMRDVPDDGFAGVGRPAEDEHIEPHRDLAEQLARGQEAQRRLGDLPLLAEIDRGGGIVDGIRKVRRGRADLDDDKRLAVEREQVEFAGLVGDVRGENAKPERAKVLGGGALASSAEPPPPPRPPREAWLVARRLGGSRVGGHRRYFFTRLRYFFLAAASASFLAFFFWADLLMPPSAVAFAAASCAAFDATSAAVFEIGVDPRLPLHVVANLGRLADAIAEVVELRAANQTGLLHHDLGDSRRMDREDALDAFALDELANR